MSRASLEAKIEKTKQRLETALRTKEFSKCSALQEELDDLIAKQEELPTRDDLKNALDTAQNDLKEALARKDFERAASLQSTIDLLTEQVEEFRSIENETDPKEDDENNHGYTSRADLESDISSLLNQIDSAVAAKDFTKAASLQENLVQLEKYRVYLPTIDELEESIQEGTKAVRKAVSAKNFKEAEDLQASLDDLQKKLDFERSQGRAVALPVAAIDSVEEKKEEFEAAIPQQKPEQKESGNVRPNWPPESVILSKTPKNVFENGRPVYKLRPKKPIVAEPYQSVLSVAQDVASGRGDAALIVLSEKGFAGVLTPHHVVTRVVAKGIDPASISVSSVMKTKQGVALDDSAGDALSVMLEHKHRYLPVHDNSDELVGILDIGQCLNDAIKKLKVANESGSKAVQEIVGQIAPGAHAKGLLSQLGPVLKKAFGESVSPSLRSLLAGKPSSIVDPTTTIRDAASIMAQADKAALVVEQGRLIGIVTVKHIMERAVAKQVLMENTTVESIMDSDPVPVGPDITAIEALQIMHEDRVLSLPVCEENGTPLGSVDVMDLIYGCGGAEGWRSIFDTSMAADDLTEAESSISGLSSSKVATRSHVSVPPTREFRPVYKLRPRKPVVAEPGQSVLSVAQIISKARGDAALIRLENKPGFAGVVTPHHVTERVLAKGLDPSVTPISSVMKTKKAVKMFDSAGDALTNMLENRHRYLPVMDDKGALVGILDIGQCLSDAITKLEQAKETNSKVAEDVLAQVAMAKGGPGDHVNKLQALLGPILQVAFGASDSPKLSTLLEGKASNIVTPDTSVEQAAFIIANHEKAALVVEGGELVGMVTVKDIMEMAVAKELDPKQTSVDTIMTTHPQCVAPDMTALEALQVMHQDRVSSLPVCDDAGNVFGSVDVLDLIYGCGGVKGWKSIFDSSFETGDNASGHSCSNTRSSTNKPTMSPTTPRKSHIHSPEVRWGKQVPRAQIPEMGGPPIVPTLVEIPQIPFKIVYPDGTIRLLRCKPTLEEIIEGVGDVELAFVDAEGDSIAITSDECLEDAVKQAESTATSGQSVKLQVVRQSSKLDSLWKSVSSKISSPISVETFSKFW